MSNTAVENEVVRMQFDNRQFEAGVKQSMSTLDKLKAALHLDKSAQGFKQIGDAAKKVNFNPITNGIEAVKKSFTYMDVAFATAVARMTNDAITAGKRIASALTIDPVKTGLSEYETKLNAVQVMKSNRGGTIEEITEALDELNRYADKTIYNFTQMTSNVGKFVAQGMKAGEAAKAVQGLANLAGASGASAEDMARATYQMSQAMGGTIRKIDWNSLRNANMATMQLKDVLKEVAKTEYGVDVDALIKAKGTFEDSLEKGWLTGSMFSEAMQMYSDAYDEATLKQKGYNDAQIKMFKDLAKEAAEATTSVKTLSQLWDVIKETAQSGWTQTWEIILGDLEQAKKLFTGINNVISGYIDRVSRARNKMLDEWARGNELFEKKITRKNKEGKNEEILADPNKLGGRDLLFSSLARVLGQLVKIISNVKKAFRDIFPPLTGQRLYELTKRFSEFTKLLKISDESVANIYYTFRGLFSVLGLFRDIITEVIKALFPVFSTARDLTEIILRITGFIGNLLYVVTKAIRESGAIQSIVSSISNFIGELLYQIGRIIYQILRLIHETGLDSFLIKIAGYLGDVIIFVLEHLVTVITKIADIIEYIIPKVKLFFGGLYEAAKSGKLIDFLVYKFNQLKQAIQNLGKGGPLNERFVKLGNFFEKVVHVIAKAITSMYEFGKSLDISQALALGLSVLFGLLLFRLSGMVKAITGATTAVSTFFNTLTTFTKKLKLHNPVILELAIFIGILTGSIYTLSKIDVGKIWNGVGAIFALSVIMGGFMIVLQKTVNILSATPKGIILGTAALFITLSIAMIDLATAVQKLSQVNPKKALISIGLIGAMMLELVGITTIILEAAPRFSVASLLTLAFCASLSKLVNMLVKIDFTMLESVSVGMIRAAGVLGIAALMLGIGVEKLSFSILRLTTGLLLIAATFKLLESIKVSIGSVFAVLGALISLFVITQLISDAAMSFGDAMTVVDKVGMESSIKSKGIKEFSKAVVRVVVAMGLLIGVFKLAELLKPNLLTFGILANVVIDMLGFIVALALLGKYCQGSEKEISALGRTLLKISISLAIMVTVCTALAAIALLPGGVGVIIMAGVIFAGLVAAVGWLIKCSKLGSQVKMGPIFVLLAGVSMMFASLVILAGLKPESILAATIAVGGVMMSVGYIIDIVSGIKAEIAMKNIGLLLSFSVMMGVFAASMALLANYPWEDIAIRIFELIGTIAALEILIVSMSKVMQILAINKANIVIAAQTTATLGLTMLAIAAALAIVPDFDGSKIGMLAAGLGVLIAAVAGVALIGNWATVGINKLAISLATLGISLKPLALTLTVFTAAFVIFVAALTAASMFLNGWNAVVILGGFVATLAVLVALAPEITVAGSALLIFAGAVAILGAAAALTALGILEVAKAIKLLSDIDPSMLLDMAVGLTALAGAFLLISVLGTAVLLAVLPISALAGSLAILSLVDFTSMSNGIMLFSAALSKLVPDFMTLIGSSLGIGVFTNKITELEPALINSALAMNLLVMRMEEFVSLETPFVNAANHIGTGLKKGLTEGLSNAMATMSNGARGLISSFTGPLEIHSPSRVFMRLGAYTMEGVALGIKNAYPEIDSNLKDVTKKMTDTLSLATTTMSDKGKEAGQNYISGVSDGMDDSSSKGKIKTTATNTGTNASNATANAIVTATSVIANAAANSGSAAGAAFVTAMGNIVGANMPKIASYVSGVTAAGGSAHQSHYKSKWDNFNPDEISYAEFQSATLGGKNSKAMEAAQEYWAEHGGTNSDAYKAWKKATDKAYQEAQKNAEIQGISGAEKLWNGFTSTISGGQIDELKGKFTDEVEDVFGLGDLQSQLDLSYDWKQTGEFNTNALKSAGYQVEVLNTEVLKYRDQMSGLAGTANALYDENKFRQMGYELDDLGRWVRVTNKETGEVITGEANKVTDALNGTSTAIGNLGETAKETESEMDTFTKSLNSNLKSAMNYFDEFKYGTEEDKISKEQLLKNLEDQHNGMINWAKDMEELASRGMAKDLWKNLAEEGPASYAKVKAFLDMTASELQSANEWFARDLALPDVTTSFMEQIMGSYYGDYSNLFIARGQAAGEDLNKGTKEGLDKNLGETKESAKNAGSQVADSYCKDGTGEGSPSWKTREAGQYMNLGLIEGIKNNLNLVTRFAAKCGDTIVRSYSRSLNPKEFRNIGKNAMVGLYNGIVSEVSRLFKLVQEISYKIPHTIKGTWEIKSPSRLFKSFGMYAMEGLANGLSQYSALAEAAAAETADNTTKTLNGITNSVLDWDTDFNPVITPTLNLDNVTRGVREINDMFKETTLDTVVEDPVQNGGTTPQPSTTFIQNNYSPKHLSSIDIYRQTRNQLSSLKGAMG